MKKVLLRIIVICLALYLIIWVGSIIKCEIYTHKYGDDIIDEYKSNLDYSYWIDGYSFVKIISFSSSEAKVYYINDNSGYIVRYMKINEHWEAYMCDLLWTHNGGSADNSIWPYWYHNIFSVYG